MEPSMPSWFLDWWQYSPVAGFFTLVGLAVIAIIITSIVVVVVEEINNKKLGDYIDSAVSFFRDIFEPYRLR